MEGSKVKTKRGRVARSGRTWRQDELQDRGYALRVGLGEDMGQEGSPARGWKLP